MAQQDQPEVLCVATSAWIWAILTLLLKATPAQRARFLGGSGELQWCSLQAEQVTEDSRGLGPCKFAALRLLMSLVVLGLSFANAALGFFDQTFATFSGWTSMLVGMYFLLAAVCSLLGMCTSKNVPNARPLHHGVWVIYQMATAAAIFVFAASWLSFLWIATGPAEERLGRLDMGGDMLVTFTSHNVNAIFMLVEVYLNRMPFVESHILFVMAWGNLNIAVSWMHFLAAGFFYSSHMDWRNYHTSLVYLLFMLGLYGCFQAALQLGPLLKGSVEPDVLPPDALADLTST